MSEEEYYLRMSKLNAKISTDRTSEDEIYHIALQKNYLSTQYIKNIESQLQEKEKIIEDAIEYVKSNAFEQHTREYGELTLVDADELLSILERK